MAEFPALPLFTDAYLADTRHLTTEEHGAYLLLLICAWRSRGCALRDNDKTLARIAGLSPTRWRRMKPALVDFFDIEDGLWKQKKLTSVYAGVAVRVARNRANGAKGGRAARATRASKPRRAQQPSGHCTETGNAVAATKTKAKTKAESAAAMPENEIHLGNDFSNDSGKDSGNDPGKDSGNEACNTFDAALWRSVASNAVGAGLKMDTRILKTWHDAGVDLDHDMAPTLKAITVREIERTGTPPRMLAYYREAVLEAMEARLADEASTQIIARKRASKIMFDRTSVDHWQQILGDASSRFRGDYMAQNWFIGRDHPVFLPTTLGPNPRFTYSDIIPAAVYSIYGRKWQWLGADTLPKTK